MKIFQIMTRCLLAVMGCLLALSAFAQDDYYTRVNPPQPTDNPAKIEVIEFFYYGCPHCSNLHKPLNAWVAKLPADVVFKRVPVTFKQAALINNARLFYALEATGQLDRLDSEVFKAFDQKIKLFDESTLNGWLATKGVDSTKFMEVYKSFGVDGKVKRADQLANAYKITGVPAIVIDGKYLLEPRAPTEFLANADRMIAKVRAERGK